MRTFYCPTYMCIDMDVGKVYTACLIKYNYQDIVTTDQRFCFEIEYTQQGTYHIISEGVRCNDQRGFPYELCFDLCSSTFCHHSDMHHSQQLMHYNIVVV